MLSGANGRNRGFALGRGIEGLRANRPGGAPQHQAAPEAKAFERTRDVGLLLAALEGAGPSVARMEA